MISKSSTGVSSPAAGWEVVASGGMLVQQRNSDSNNPVPNNNLRVKVKHGVHTQLTLKEEERNSKRGEGSTEDEASRERMCFEMDKASNGIAAIRIEVDNLAKQVASIEAGINGGKKFEGSVIVKLIELLMIQLINLDGIAADGDLKSQRKMQVKRVQKYIETLDLLKIKNAAALPKLPLHPTLTEKTLQKRHHQGQESRRSEPVVAT